MSFYIPSGFSGKISRRALLRGAGVGLALPLLDAMTATDSKAAIQAAAPSAGGVPRRMVAVQTNMGILPQYFFPDTEGADYKPTPYLETLTEFRSRMTVFSGVSHPDVDGAHEAEKAFLTAAPHPGASGFKSTLSLDQYAAERLGATTRFPTFTLAINAEGTQGMAYTRSGVKIPTEQSPAALYKRMFVQGSAAEIEQRLSDLRDGRSLLDFVSDDAHRLKRDISAADKERIDQYFTAVRDLEQQLAKAQEWEHKPKPKVTVPQPTDVSEARQLVDRTRLLFQMVNLAIETDSTRLVTIFINTASIVPAIPGVSQETHSLTHHGNRPEALDQLKRIETAQFRVLAEFLSALNRAKEGPDTLLDRTMVLYGTCMGSANSHANTNLPILLAGGGFRHKGHLMFDTKRNYPLPNLYVSMLQRLGLETDRFATSTSTMRGLELA